MNNNRKYKENKIYLIGVGKVGSALYHSLISCGYNIRFATDTNIERLKRITAGNNTIRLSSNIRKYFLDKSDVAVISVPDKSLNKVVKRCNEFNLDLSDKILFHTSGIETSELFKDLNVNIRNIGSFHPLQTFNIITYNNTYILNNIYYGIEGGSNAIKYFIECCKDLKSKYLIIPRNKKPLYHCLCVMASNFLVSHYNIISKLSKKIKTGLNKNLDAFKPIVLTTIDNIFNQGTENALTGPFVRGDSKTIDLHLKYLKKNYPALSDYYILLGMEATKISLNKKYISEKAAKEIEKLFWNYI